jgi:hypothetical protein
MTYLHWDKKGRARVRVALTINLQSFEHRTNGAHIGTINTPTMLYELIAVV